MTWISPGQNFPQLLKVFDLGYSESIQQIEKIPRTLVQWVIDFIFSLLKGVIVDRFKRDGLVNSENGLQSTSFSNNLDILRGHLRGHLKNKLFVEVGRRQVRAAEPGRGLGRIGKWNVWLRPWWCYANYVKFMRYIYIYIIYIIKAEAESKSRLISQLN